MWNALQAFLDPRSPERRELCRQRWNSLPAPLRTPQQAAGRAHVACGATHGILEKCDFACSACYLTPIANSTPALPFKKVRDQLDLLRSSLGPMGKVQITSGEVTLLEPDELGRIVAYAREIGLDPMVMTNGQRFTDDPDYLLNLVQEFGLGKVAFHVDTTQHGRRAFPSDGRERSLHTVRDHFAAMIRSIRKQSGQPLDAAQTVTVTTENIDQVPDILDWSLRNHDAMRMLSFQPVAEIGRTRDRDDVDVTVESVWNKIRQALGIPLNRDALHYGHPSCNILTPLFVVTMGDSREIVECVPEGDRRGAALMSHILVAMGGIDPIGSNLFRGLARLAVLLLRNPDLLASGLVYAGNRAWRERRLIGTALGRLIRFLPVRIRPWILVVHGFMNGEELQTEEGRQRLEACVFRVPVDGRMVSMCELNATEMRLRLNQDQLKPFHQDRSSFDLPAASSILR